MIHALIERNGRTLLIIGLEEEEMRQLRQGGPIVIDGTENGMECSVDTLVLSGPTAEHITRRLAGMGITLALSPEQVAAARPEPNKPVVFDTRKKKRRAPKG
jgi:hypothetical protein